MPEQGKSKKGRGSGRQFRNQTHKRYNARHGYVSKSNPRWQNKKKVPAAVRARIRAGLGTKLKPGLALELAQEQEKKA